jgi:hypothetical protein
LKLTLQFLIFSCGWQEKIRNVRMVVEALSKVARLLKEPQLIIVFAAANSRGPELALLTDF